MSSRDFTDIMEYEIMRFKKKEQNMIKNRKMRIRNVRNYWRYAAGSGAVEK